MAVADSAEPASAPPLNAAMPDRQVFAKCKLIKHCLTADAPSSNLAMMAGLNLVEIAQTPAGVQHLITTGLTGTCIAILSAAKYANQHTRKAHTEALVLCQCIYALAEMVAAAGLTAAEAPQAAVQLSRYLVNAKEQEGGLHAANGIANVVNSHATALSSFNIKLTVSPCQVVQSLTRLLMEGYADDVDRHRARLCMLEGSYALAAFARLTVSKLQRAICQIALPALAKMLGDSQAPQEARQHAVNIIKALAEERRLRSKLCSNADGIAALVAAQAEGLDLSNTATGVLTKLNEFKRQRRTSYCVGAASVVVCAALSALQCRSRPKG